MTKERYVDLMTNINLALTDAEVAEGWHFCNKLVGLLAKGNPAKQFCDDDCIKWVYDSLKDDL